MCLGLQTSLYVTWRFPAGGEEELRSGRSCFYGSYENMPRKYIPSAALMAKGSLGIIKWRKVTLSPGNATAFCHIPRGPSDQRCPRHPRGLPFSLSGR